ncbi:GGDEF domain-containing protein [Aquamicrobium sp. LC103]|uniref:GGDEF domain-containing protein n=1 Tax=Aquamicrobium sp. LC103 TaxID=1120658 RepID=UPI00063ED2CB|nr:GGDEF domain-containing protein [Aquamicrobium sp. LC103]TKT82839.1 GGDEF domain-containing protein [Aquamicrobium sp. LC103]
MSGASVVVIINLLIAGLFCAFFVVIALYDRHYASARWFAAAYAFGMVNVAGEFLLPAMTEVRMPALVAYLAFLSALTVLNVGIARRYAVRVPGYLMAGAYVASVAVAMVTQDMPRESVLRMFLYQAPYFVMQAIGAWIVLKAGTRRTLDYALAGFLLFSAVHFLSKPALATLVGGIGADPQSYLGTTYALISQSMGTVLAVATALLLMTMLMIDILRDVTARSETDPLSGVLNRRGFEERLEKMVARSAVGVPMTLVICDLDHFKSVNDTFGHAAGDRLIAVFASILKEASTDHHLIGRIGGEEFAALLPGSHLAAGRLFAESARSVFGQLRMEGLPARKRFSASFGVAELQPGESASALLARADAALYEAKRAGRDCVRTSLIPLETDRRRASSGQPPPAW